MNCNFADLVNIHQNDIREFQTSGVLSVRLFESLFQWYSSSGEMPYVVAKSQSGHRPTNMGGGGPATRLPAVN